MRRHCVAAMNFCAIWQSYANAMADKNIAFGLRRLAGNSRNTLRLYVSGTVKPLSARELQVLTLIAHGYCYKEIANELGISPNTIKNHLTRAREKLEAKSTAHAIF